ncbi:DMT family transporter, partial [uncultured Ruegeria sp.]|uniref:DMT family transporter n=1 Tax=uncultured Ruegeria sp. TaxID=259304 RepID=UPI00260F93F0
VDLNGAALMVAAGLGWALYSIAGRSETNPLEGTAANFIVALPLTAMAMLATGGVWQMNGAGYLLAVLSGGVTSGLGYALWYRVLPQLAPSVAAVVQLSVPVIAILGGVAFLGEVAKARLIIGTALVLGGIALAVLRRQKG